MAKVTIAGKAIVITSALKLEELETVKKYSPKSLILMGGEDGKEPLFGVGVVRGKSGSISSVGAEFGEETHNETKLATMTFLAPPETEDVKEYVADKYGAALMSLNALEATLPAVLAGIEARKQEVLNAIEVAM